MQPMDIRRAIVKQMEAKEWSQYQLAEKLKGKVPARTVYNFLRRENPTSVNVVALGHIFDALGMTIAAK